VLILLSSAPERLLATIRSRCQQIPFARLDATAMARVLDRLDPAQSSQPDPDPPALLDLAAGSPGALLHHREQWRALPRGGWPIGCWRDPRSDRGPRLARDLCEALDLDQQLWLLNWWAVAALAA